MLTLPELTNKILQRNSARSDEGDATDVKKMTSRVLDVTKLPRLANEDDAVAILRYSIINKEHICIASDYDSDGLNAAAIAYRGLTILHPYVTTIVNHRKDGNGFNPVLVDSIKKLHARRPIDVLITVDHGSSNKDELMALKEYGVKKVIITDHHDIPPDNRPDAEDSTIDVFINPHKSPNQPTGYCGGGVIFKILSNLFTPGSKDMNKYLSSCLPHAACATVGDVMGMDFWYNRQIVNAGIQYMNSDTLLWRKLIVALNIPGKIHTRHIGYVLCPFINTGNRSDAEQLFYDILVNEPTTPIDELIATGVHYNTTRKAVRIKISSVVEDRVAKEGVDKSVTTIIDCELAIAGIIANQIGETYSVPAVCFALDKDKRQYNGSARAVLPYINIVEVFRTIDKLSPGVFIKYGGHKGAGGCSVPYDKYEEFKTLFNKVVGEVPVPTDVDVVLPPIALAGVDITPGLVDIVDIAGPYGKNWPAPVFKTRVTIKMVRLFKTMGIMEVATNTGMVVSCTMFYNKNLSKDLVEYICERGKSVTITYEPQHYKRGNKTSLSFMVSNVEE